MKPTPPFFFIVGAGRSGTTLLAALLSGHSRMIVPAETHFLKRAAKSGPLNGAPTDFPAFWQSYAASSRFRDLELDPDVCAATFARSGDRSFRHLFATLLRSVGEKHGKPHVGEKTPGHWRHLATLQAWFPDARFVVIERDPRAVVASQLLSPWVKITPRSVRQGVFLHTRLGQVEHYATLWTDLYAHAMPRWLGHEPFQHVRYEDLVTQPEETLRKVCAFLDEPYEPEMLRRSRGGDDAPPAGLRERGGPAWKAWLAEHHRKVHAPISTASINKWKTSLSANEVAIVEALCGEGMAAGGYVPTTSPLRRTTGRAWAQMHLAGASLELRARRAVRRVAPGLRSV